MRRNGERGFASAWALCLLFFVLLMGMNLAAICYGVQSTTLEYERETRLELMAESRLEAFAAAMERDTAGGDAIVGKEQQERTDQRKIFAAAIPIETRIAVRRQGPRLYCVAVAWETDAAGKERKDDKWKRRKAVRGILERKETGYVWVGKAFSLR